MYLVYALQKFEDNCKQGTLPSCQEVIHKHCNLFFVSLFLGVEKTNSPNSVPKQGLFHANLGVDLLLLQVPLYLHPVTLNLRQNPR